MSKKLSFLQLKNDILKLLITKSSENNIFIMFD